jgi:hypothetical protein
MRSASPGSHRTPLQPRRHHPRRLPPARSYSIAPPPAALAASGVLRTARLIALAPAATSRPSVPLERCAATKAAVGRRRAVAPGRGRACLTGNRTRRFPGPMRPARRDRQDVCDRRSNAGGETMPRRIVTLVRGLHWVGPDAEAHSVAHHGRARPWPSTAHLRLAPTRVRGRDVQAEAPRAGRHLVLRRPPSLWNVDSFSSHTRMHAG